MPALWIAGDPQDLARHRMVAWYDRFYGYRSTHELPLYVHTFTSKRRPAAHVKLKPKALVPSDKTY